MMNTKKRRSHCAVVGLALAATLVASGGLVACAPGQQAGSAGSAGSAAVTVAKPVTAEEMTELLQQASFAGESVAPAEDENISITAQDGHVLVAEVTDADDATVAAHLARRPAALMASIAQAEEDVEEGAATDVTWTVTKTDGTVRAALTVAADAEPVSLAAGEATEATDGELICASTGWALDLGVTTAAGLDVSQATGGTAPTQLDGTAIAVPSAADAKAAQDARAAEQAAQQEQASSSSSSGSSSNGSSGGSSSSGGPSSSGSSQGHTHTWTEKVVGVYEDRPTIVINWDRVAELEAEYGVQYNPETAFWFQNQPGVASEGPAESEWVGNDYVRTCTVCGYSEVYDRVRY